MNNVLKIASASILLLLLSGCASTQKTAYGNAPMQSETTVVDQRYVSLVEHLARQRGTRVVWVNTPKKRAVVVADTAH